MSELTPEQFAKTFSDEANVAAVEDYLSVSTDEEIRQQASDLMPKGRTVTAEQAVEEALELLARSRRAAIRHREKLLGEMNYETLMLLLNRIGYNLEMLSQDRHITGLYSPSGEREIDDPVKGPVFVMIQRRLPSLPKAPELQRHLEIVEAIQSAKERTNVRYPGLPCELESALRWAADAPDVPYGILKRAFVDFLVTHDHDEDTDSIHEDLAYHKLDLERTKGDRIRTDQIRHEMKDIRKRLNFIEQVNGHRSSFKPGKTNVPKKVAARAKEIFDKAWNRPEPVELKSTLAHLATRFHPFWEKHAAAYKKLADEKSSTNKDSGVGGPTSRMRAPWQRRTDDFVKFAKGRNIPEVGSDDCDHFFSEFANFQPEQPRTRKIIAAFMKTLLVNASKSSSDNEVIKGLLEKEQIKAVDSETIRSCLEKLKAVKFR